MKEQLLSAVCVYAAQFVGRNRFYLIIKACMNHEFSMSGDFRHFSLSDTMLLFIVQTDAQYILFGFRSLHT